jgi:hypothetical protein
MPFMGRELSWVRDSIPAPSETKTRASYWQLAPASSHPPFLGLERYTHVPGGRGILHLPGALTHAS